MRRRRFVASVPVLAAVAGCFGSDRQRNSTNEDDGEGRPTGNDWEPAPTTSAKGEEQESEAATTRSEESTEPNDESRGENEREGSESTEEGEKPEDTEIFENGESWEANRAQVAVEESETGRAIEFEVATTPPRECGRTCRELRAALSNTGSEAARDVVVRTVLKTSDGVLRERRDAIGDLPPGATYRASERVELGPLEALRVRRNGAITIEQVVTSATRREVFRRRIEL